MSDLLVLEPNTAVVAASGDEANCYELAKIASLIYLSK